jgi:MinD-like ATPase involved in chromosome partitioning or flagellar assembly
VLCILLLAAGAEWEAEALNEVNKSPDMVVLKRCVDVSDLMGAATTGQADIALVAMQAPGLDVEAVDHLRRHRVRTIGVGSGGARADEDLTRARRLGMAAHLAVGEMGGLAEVIHAGADDEVALEAAELVQASREDVAPSTSAGRVIAIWGPAGSPGRTTVAIGIALEIARRRQRTTLIDADPWGGAVAQHLGVLDEVSGVLASARLTANGELAERFASVQRRLGDHLTVVTGLPRPDRWSEVRSGTMEHLCELSASRGHVVVDTGFSLEEESALDVGSRPSRNSMTLAVLESADEVLVVGGADPVGLARLARGLADLQERFPDLQLRVVINRARSSLGWSQREMAVLVGGFARIRSVHFLPEDRTSTDQALVAGSELPDGPLARALSDLVDALFPDLMESVKGRGLRKKTAGRVRLR